MTTSPITETTNNGNTDRKNVFVNEFFKLFIYVFVSEYFLFLL